jgi:hypothetical protein
MALSGDPTATYRFPNEQEATLWRTGIDKKLDHVVTLVSELAGEMREMRLRVSNLEKAPTETRKSWQFGLSGCSTALMAASVCISLVGVLSGITGLLIAVLK